MSSFQKDGCIGSYVVSGSEDNQVRVRVRVRAVSVFLLHFVERKDDDLTLIEIVND
jgi:hypothetical protein